MKLIFLVNANHLRKKKLRVDRGYFASYTSVENAIAFYRDLSDNHLEELPSDLLANLGNLQELYVKLRFPTS